MGRLGLLAVRELPESGTKKCRDCGTHKGAAEFHANPRGRYGLHPYCMPCTAIRSKRAEEKRKVERGKYPRHRAPRGTYQRLLIEQGGTCAICGTPPAAKRLAIDHCHDTGEIRGLLCAGCNLAIGRLGDNAEGVQRALDYLRR